MKKMGLIYVLLGIVFSGATVFGESDQEVRRAIYQLEEVRSDLYDLDNRIGSTIRSLEYSLKKSDQLQHNEFIQCSIVASGQYVNKTIYGVSYKTSKRATESAQGRCQSEVRQKWEDTHKQGFSLTPNQKLAMNKVGVESCRGKVDCERVICKKNNDGELIYGGLLCIE